MSRGYRIFLAALLILTALSVFFISRLQFSNDMRDLLPEDDPAVRTFQEVSEQFGLYTDLYLLLTTQKPDPERLKQAADFAGQALRDSRLFRRVDARIPFTREEIQAFALKYGALYLTVPEIQELLDSFGTPEAPKVIQKYTDNYRSRWEGTEYFDMSEGYLMSKDKSAILIVAAGEKPPQDIPFSKQVVEATSRLSDEMKKKFPEVTLDMTGGYPMAVISEKMARADTVSTVLTSLIGVLILFLITFRTWQAVPLALLPLAVGMVLTFGIAAAIYGKLTVVTIAFAAMLIGLAIDFPIHLYSTALQGKPMDLTYRAVILAAQTTAVAFLALIFSKLPGLRSLGLLSGVGMLVCLTVTVLLFPFLWRMFHPSRTLHPSQSRESRRFWSPAAVTPVLTFALLLTAALCFFAFRHGILKIPFEEDVTQLRNKDDHSFSAYQKLKEKYGTSFTPLVVLVRGRSEEEVIGRCQKIREAMEPLVQNHTLSRCQSVSDVIPPRFRQDEVIRYLKTVPVEEKVSALKSTLQHQNVPAFQAGVTAKIVESMLKVREPIDVDRYPFLGEVRRRLLCTAPEGVSGIIVMTSRESLATLNRRSALLSELEQRIHSADPEATQTGLAFLGTRLEAMVRTDVRSITLIVGALIVVMTWLHFRSVGHTLLALTPVILATFWTIGAVNLLEIKLNNLNILVFPLILGIGVDNGIHIVTRVRTGMPVGEIMAELSRPMLMTLLTTMLGFGTFMFARFTVLNIFGTTMMIALTSCLVSSMFVLPALLHRIQTRHVPS